MVVHLRPCACQWRPRGPWVPPPGCPQSRGPHDRSPPAPPRPWHPACHTTSMSPAPTDLPPSQLHNRDNPPCPATSFISAVRSPCGLSSDVDDGGAVLGHVQGPSHRLRHASHLAPVTRHHKHGREGQASHSNLEGETNHAQPSGYIIRCKAMRRAVVLTTSLCATGIHTAPTYTPKTHKISNIGATHCAYVEWIPVLLCVVWCGT